MIERRGKKRPKNILLVGVGQETLHTLKNALETAGYKTTTALKAKEALNAVADASFDLVIVDEETPEMPGLSFAGMMKAAQATKNTPIALVSYSYSEKIREDGFRAGVIGFLHSPFTERDYLQDVPSHPFKTRLRYQGGP